MSENAEIWECPKCKAPLDISELGFYKEVQCPSCGHSEIIHTQLANFKLTGVLGIGGMSVVFKATDLILNRPLAIKVLNDTYKDQPERIARFENECAMMARVRHDNVVSVYSAGRARGQFYIAMEVVRGHDMEHVIRQGKPLSPAAALDVTREVALGLQAAAQAGLLHRDMKPGNILISQMNGRAKVLDFGLSLGAQTEDTEEVIWATPFYVAPETLRREQEDVRTDIYALGMTLRFLLTGVDKLPGEFSSIPSLLQAKQKLPPFADEYAQATTALVDLVDHMTAFAAADRPPSYQELLQELDEAREIQRHEDALKAPQRFAEKRRVRRMCAGISILVGLVGAGFVAGFSLPEPKQEKLHIAPLSDWGNIETFEKALQTLARADWKAARFSFERLDNVATEPTLAATSALICYYLALTEHDSMAQERFLKDLHTHVSREKECYSSTLHFFEQLKITDEVLQNKEKYNNFELVARPIMRAFVHAAMADRLAGTEPEAAQEHIDGAKVEFLRSHSVFAKLPERLDQLISAPDTTGLSGGKFAEVGKALQAHDFAQCDARLAELLNDSKMADEAKNKARALKEICSVASVAVELFQKRVQDSYRPGMSPEDMRSAAAKLRDEEFGAEMYCLALLIKGEYNAAFAANPYKNASQSDRPFAVLMRHWQDLLGVEDLPLHINKTTASETIQAMQTALKNGANVNAPDKAGDTPLHYVIRTANGDKNTRSIVTFLCETASADFNARNKAGETPLDVAFKRFGERGSTPLYLVEHGATAAQDPAESKNPAIAECRMLYGIRKKDIEVCRKALNNGANARSSWIFDTTEKVQRLGSPGWTEIVRLLLDHGMDPNARKWFSIMHQAREPKTVELLLERGADANLRAGYGFTPLFNVGKADVAEVLVRHGADVNYKTPDGQTPLSVNWAVEMVKFLLEKGADMSIRTRDGSTCMHSWRGSLSATKEILSIFISKGADVNARDNNGNTPMHGFVSRYSSSSAKALFDLLRNNGANPNIKNNAGETPLDLCVKRFGENSDCANYLRKNGAKSGK